MTSATTVLAFDFGLRRIGVAVGQTISGTASALTTLSSADSVALWPQIDALIREWRPDALLVGEPPPRADAKALFAGLDEFLLELTARDLPVHRVDEGGSTLEANAALIELRRSGARKRIARPEIDAQAARIIAERWLDAQRQAES